MFTYLGSYVVLQVDLKANTLEALFDAYQRDKDIIQQAVFNKTDEILGMGDRVSAIFCARN